MLQVLDTGHCDILEQVHCCRQEQLIGTAWWCWEDDAHHQGSAQNHKRGVAGLVEEEEELLQDCVDGLVYVMLSQRNSIDL